MTPSDRRELVPGDPYRATVWHTRLFDLTALPDHDLSVGDDGTSRTELTVGRTAARRQHCR